MTKCLSTGQVEKYHDDGALAPVRVFSSERATDYLRKLERFEIDRPEIAKSVLHIKPHLVFCWADELVRAPEILDVIEDLIGPDILVYNSAVWIKEPGDGTSVGWHQDCAYYPLEPAVQVTAWIALTDSVEDNGNVKYIAGSHRLGELKHSANRGTTSLLSQGQSIHRAFDQGLVKNMALLPGEMSLHHTRTVHFSEPNHSARRRIGFGVNYMPASVQNRGSVRHTAMLVRGVDKFKNFDQEPRVQCDMDSAAQLAHRDAVARFRAARVEAVAAHDSKFQVMSQ